MDKIVFIILQTVFFAVSAPLLSGLITKMKNNLRMRKGQSIFQPYYNFVKLFSKEEVVSQDASWIFRIAPFVVLASSLCGAYLIPAVSGAFLGRMGDLLALIFIFALGRFFLALAALDTGSSFGGMGSSREMFISSLAEPAFCLVIFTIFLKTGSTSLAGFNAAGAVPVSFVVAGISLFLIMLAETSRIPVDNQETHLELTMVHEAMVLEYSGRRLALIELASYIKQMIFFYLIAEIVLPVPVLNITDPVHMILWSAWYFIRFILIAALVSLVEVSIAKMRLFRVADFLGFAFVLAVVAGVCAMLGV